MGKLTVKCINVNKDTKLDDFGYDSMACKIISALQDIQEDATIVRIERYEGTQDEKVKMIRNVCNAYDTTTGSYKYIHFNYGCIYYIYFSIFPFLY